MGFNTFLHMVYSLTHQHFANYWQRYYDSNYCHLIQRFSNLQSIKKIKLKITSLCQFTGTIKVMAIMNQPTRRGFVDEQGQALQWFWPRSNTLCTCVKYGASSSCWLLSLPDLIYGAEPEEGCFSILGADMPLCFSVFRDLHENEQTIFSLFPYLVFLVCITSHTSVLLLSPCHVQPFSPPSWMYLGMNYVTNEYTVCTQIFPLPRSL